MRALLTFILCALCCTTFTGSVLAASSSDITKSIQNQKKKANQAQKRIKKLTAEERRLHRDLADAADRIQLLERDIAKKQKALSRVETERDKAQTDYQQLAKARKSTEDELEALIKTMWPLYVQNRANRGLDTPDWHEADRKYAWTSRLYATIAEKQQTLVQQEEAIARALGKHEALASKAKNQLTAINQNKSSLLRNKLKHRKRLARVRKQKDSAENSLRGVLDVIQQLNFQLEKGGTNDKQFKLFKGTLPWPADGMVAQRYNPKGKPPVRGLGMALIPGAQISAVATGKVVHSDVLRGFGHVVILLHGSSYYTLYAFMEDSPLTEGQQVKRGQALGEAGYYPKVEGPGLYFELRFHQKAINPEVWLTALN